MARLKLEKPIKTPLPWRKAAYPDFSGAISQKFGENNLPWYKERGLKGHSAIDIRYARIGSHPPVYAAHQGTILENVTDKSGGLGVRLVTDKQYLYKGKNVYFWTIYWHLLNFQRQVGDKIAAGTIIGMGDSTGKSTGPHLHFGLKPLIKKGTRFNALEPSNGYAGYIDPMPYFASMFRFVRKSDRQDQYIVNDDGRAWRVTDGDTKRFVISLTNADPKEDIITSFKSIEVMGDFPSSKVYEEERQQHEAYKEVFKEE